MLKTLKILTKKTPKESRLSFMRNSPLRYFYKMTFVSSVVQRRVMLWNNCLGPWPPCWPLCISDRSCSCSVYKNGPRVIKGQKLRKRKIVCVFFASFKCYIMLKISLWNHLFRRISRFSIQIVRVSCFAPFSVTAFFW